MNAPDKKTQSLRRGRKTAPPSSSSDSCQQDAGRSKAKETNAENHQRQTLRRLETLEMASAWGSLVREAA